MSRRHSACFSYRRDFIRRADCYFLSNAAFFWKISSLFIFLWLLYDDSMNINMLAIIERYAQQNSYGKASLYEQKIT